MSEERNTQMDKQKDAVSGWRYLGIWLTMILGLALALCLIGQHHLTLTPMAPFVLTLGGVSIIGISAICVWGLLFIVPIVLLVRGWLKGQEPWWRLLPPAGLLMSMLSMLAVTMMGLKLPMTEDSTLAENGEQAVEPSAEILDKSLAIMGDAWRQCGVALVLVVVLFALYVLLTSGWKRSRDAVSSQWCALRDYSRKLRAESAAEDAAREAAKAAKAAEKEAAKAAKAAEKTVEPIATESSKQ